MSGRGVRKRCRDCKRTANGTPGRIEWCDCGGEMIAIRYRPAKWRARNGNR